MSLALEVCRIAESHLPGHQTRVMSVGVDVGRDAGIETANFRFCLEALLTEPPFAGARAYITEQPGSDLRVVYVEVDDDDPHH